MATNNIELKSIRSLSGLKFYIPDYQRGYRWSDGQVKQMLNDFKEFCKRIDDEQVKAGEFYCLQPIVVKKRTWTDTDGGQTVTTEGYEVIDGQQRLTTLFIILKSIEQVCQILYPQFKFYSIKYETRLEYDSQNFLQNINNRIAQADEFIDFYYMKLVHDAVSSWFKANPDDTLKIARALLEQSVDSDMKIDKAKNVRVIWYEVMDEESATSIDIFTRLNIGKIPLTNAELIKALLLRRGNFVDTDVTMKQLQIAAEWNRIEQKLQDDSFWYFLYRTDNPFTYENRIEFIFDLMKNRTKDSEFYHTFNEFNNELEKLQADKEHYRNDQACIDKIWDGVKDVFQTLEEWFEDRNLYHYIGFLIEYKSDIKKLMNASTSMNKTQFLDIFIKKEISEKIAGINLDDLSFNDSKGNVKKVLLLFNILTVLQDKKSNLRFPFNKYKVEKWDIEHVDSFTTNPLTEIEQQKEWLITALADLKEYGIVYSEKEKITEAEAAKIDSFLEDQDSTVTFNEIKLIVSKLAGEYLPSEEVKKDVKNTIGNLTLLNADINRGYGNSIFPSKKKQITKKDAEGRFIPICTKNVFLKNFIGVNNTSISWSETDMKQYRKNIVDVLDKFLIKEG